MGPLVTTTAMTGIGRDYYEILGVPRTASAREIHRAFRNLARQWHPDVSQHEEAAARFQELSTAYDVLHDPDARARYDSAAGRVRAVAPTRAAQRPTFGPRGRSHEVPRFLDEDAPRWPRLHNEDAPRWPPVVMRLSAVIRWLR